MPPTTFWLVFSRFQTTFLSQSKALGSPLSWNQSLSLTMVDDEEQRASSVGELTALQAAGVLIS